ncbi:hypothetical protein LUW77_03170 [Streptomyces radiopugnans]|nr:hypothetical protein LUW77_03170 [Streptomyces radiopugnans]
MSSPQPATAHTNGLNESRQAIQRLVNLYLDNVPVEELDREQLAETLYEGMSDELDRLYRAQTTLTDLAERWEQMAKGAPDLGGDLFITEPTAVQQRQAERANTYRKAAADLRDVLRTGRVPHDLMTDAELEQHGPQQ